MDRSTCLQIGGGTPQSGSWQGTLKAFVVAVFMVAAASTTPKATHSDAESVQGIRLVVTPFRAITALDGPVAATIDPRMATNLSQSARLTVLERARLQEALQALKIEASAIIDPQLAVQIGTFMSATHVMLGEFSRAGGLVSLNARVIDVRTGQVLATASKTVDGRDSEAFDMSDLLSTYVLRGLTGETKIFREKVLDQEFSFKTERYRAVVPPFKRQCQPLLQKSAPAIVVTCVAEYYPADGIIEAARGTDKVRRLDVLVNNEVVASFAPESTDSTIEKPLMLDLGQANITTSARITVASAQILRIPVNVITEVKGRIQVHMRR